MKYKNALTAVLLASLCGSLSAAVSITAYDRLGLSSPAPGQVIPSVEVQAGDMVVWSVATNKKLSVMTMSFGASVAGTVVVDVDNNITDYGTVVTEIVFTALDAGTLLGGTDPNPTSWVGYAEIPTGGTYDFTATASANNTCGAMLYIVRADSGELVFLDADAVEWSGDESIPLSLGYTWDTEYDDVAVIEAASAQKGAITSNTAIVDWSNVDDGAEPPAYLPGVRLNCSALTSGTSFASSYDFTFDEANLGKNRGSLTGVAIAEVAGSGGNTWKGYPVGDAGYVDTGGWLGWVNVIEDPWIYSVPFASWMYISTEQSGEGGAWVYVLR
ncbi:MAG: hypothetical protein AB3N64_10780 [Puniceicoccaceae bacterium]